MFDNHHMRTVVGYDAAGAEVFRTVHTRELAEVTAPAQADQIVTPGRGYYAPIAARADVLHGETVVYRTETGRIVECDSAAHGGKHGRSDVCVNPRSAAPLPRG